MKGGGFGILLGCFFIFGVQAQNTSTNSEKPAPAESKGAVPPKESGDISSSNLSEKSISLFEKTLGQDLITADYFSLIQWARELGLPDTGGVEDLRKRIAEHYSLPKDALSKKTDQEPGKVVVIESAQTTEYFNIEEVDEDYVRLIGKVILVLTDKKTNVSHRIECDSLLMNQTTNTVTASGNLNYTMVKSDGSKDNFTGTSLTFNLENFKGIFYDGKSKRARNVGSGDLDFTYAGEVIRRSSEDSTILENGTITSSKLPDPFYRIQARKIWILAPGEWGLLDATLFVGRIPVFYFPFFYQPGDEMFFNPVVGLGSGTERRGAFLQTTTYFLGKKKKEDGGLSVLQLGGKDKDDVPRVLRGLYLVKEKEKKPEANPIPSDWYLKLMVDGYTNLGLIGGLEFKLGTLGPIKNLGGFLGMGFTRNIYFINGGYTPHKLSPFDPNLWVLEQDKWNSSVLLGLPLPFRYASKLQFNFDPLSFEFAYYSDPFFDSDFSDRSENFSMFSLIGFGPKKTLTGTTAGRGDLIWKISTGFTPNLSFLSPIIKSINLTNLYSELGWGKKASTPAKEPEDPTKEFFYPNLLAWPQGTLNFSGDLFNWGNLSTGNPISTSSSANLQSPWGKPDIEPGASIDEKKTKNPGETVPSVQQSPIQPPGFPSGLSPNVFTTMSSKISLGYNISSTNRQETRFDSNQIQQVTEVNFNSPLYSRFKTDNKGDLVLGVSLFDNFLSINNSLNGNFIWQNTWFIAGVVNRIDYLRDDSTNYRMTGFNSFNSILSPFDKIPELQGTRINYSLNGKVFERKSLFNNFDSTTTFSDFFWDWAPNSVSTHGLSGTINYSPFGNNKIFSLNTNYSGILKPLIESHDLRSGFSFNGEWIKFSLNGGAIFSNDSWNPNQITSSITLTPVKDFELRNYLDWDLKNGDWAREYLVLNYNGFNLSFLMQQTIPFYFNTMNMSFTKGYSDKVWDGNNDFLPYSIDVSYNLNLNQTRLWRDRIEINTKLNSSYNMNLQQFTSNALRFDLVFEIKILDFLNINLTQKSENNSTYKYMPWLLQGVTESINPFIDLFKSFAFWDEKKRRESNFKMKNLSLGITQQFKDWSLEFNYTGSSQLRTVGTVTQYEWAPNFSLNLKWKPIPEIRTNITVDKDKNITVKTDQ